MSITRRWSKWRFIFGLLAVASLNVAAPELASAAPKAKSSVSIISGSVSSQSRVKIKVVGTGQGTVTNKTGFFSIRGKNLSGIRTIVFQSGHKTFTTTVNVPKGSKVSLQNVTLASDGSADPEQEDVEVRGTLSAVDCNASPNTFTIAPNDGGASVMMSFDPATTSIFDESNGTVVPDCATLSSTYLNAPAKAEGQQAADGSIAASELKLNPESHGGGHPEGSDFRGTVTTGNCPSSVTVQRGDGTDVTVNISASTKIKIEGHDSESSGATCTDIPLSAMVRVEGTANADGRFDASSIEVHQDEFESHGAIGTIDCVDTPQSFSFTPDGASSALTVTIGATAEIKVNGNESASCTDLVAGPAHVHGVSQPDGSGAARDVEQESGGGGGD